jgi:hypothetical protein
MFRRAGNSRPWLTRQALAGVVALGLVLGACPETVAAFQDTSNPPEQQDGGAPPGPQTPARAAQTPEQLQQLVAPIALYPDSLVAQVLAASMYPEQVVEADRWVQAHPDLKGDDLAQAVDQMSWDPSVKALTGFPTVLANMDKNISWTSSLGDAYYNQEQDVMDAIQVMRQNAEQAGNLKSTPQQTVTTQGSTVVIEPADPEVVYVPAYDPWLIYGYPIAVWPGLYPVPGIWFGGPYLSFGFGYPLGWYGGYGWGWRHWGSDWGHHRVDYDHERYRSRSTTFYNRNNYYRGGQGGAYGRPGVANRPFNGDQRQARGYEQRGEQRGAPRGEQGARPGPSGRAGGGPSGRPSEAPTYRPAPQREERQGGFGGYGNGGQARGEASRGSRSMGGGGGRGGGHR